MKYKVKLKYNINIIENCKYWQFNQSGAIWLNGEVKNNELFIIPLG